MDSVRCIACDASNDPSARFCRECGRELDPSAWPAEQLVPEPVAAPRRSRRPPAALLIALVALVASGAAAAVYLVAFRGEDSSSKAAATATATPQIEPSSQPAVETPPDANSATGVIRAHWDAIGARKYEDAYELFSAGYQSRTRKGPWTSDITSFKPRVKIRRVRFMTSLASSQAWVFADVVTRDVGPRGDSSVCNRFAGRVRVVKQSGTWRYAPNAPGHTFHRAALARDDPRCRGLFAR